MDGTKNSSKFLQHLSKYYYVYPLDWKTEKGYRLMLADFSEWKLNFSNPTPLISIDSEVSQHPAIVQFERLQDVARRQKWKHRECIVLLDGEDNGLRALTLKKHPPRFVVIDTNDQNEILKSPLFTNALLKIISSQISIAELAPYEISKPVTGTRFFGRIPEIRKVIKKAGTNFAVTGAHRVGKTSFILEIKRLLKERATLRMVEKEEPYVFLDCSIIRTPEAFIEALVQKLHPSEVYRLPLQLPEVFFPDFLDRMFKRYGTPVTIFLDEVDEWLKPENRDKRLIDLFKSSSEREDCRYIVAGFTPLIEEFQLSTSPFFRRSFEFIKLGPFNKNDLHDLVLTPMTLLHIPIEKPEEVIEGIYKETGGIPLLVQFYCLYLINQLDKKAIQSISPRILAEIHKNGEFKDLVLGSFKTSIGDEDRCVVLALLAGISVGADMNWFTLEKITHAAKKCGLPFNPYKVEQICEKLVLAGVFQHEGNKYQFSMPSIPIILRDQGLDYLLSEAKA